MSQITNETEQKTKKAKTIPFVEMLRICMAHWRWYAISLFIIMGYAVYKLITTEPMYMRSAQILIKEESKGGEFGNMAQALSEMSGVSPMSSVDNELEAIQSPAVMLEVIEALGLHTDYTDISKMRPRTLYGANQPFVLTFVNPIALAEFKVTGVLGADKKFVISEIKRKGGGDKQNFTETYTLDLNQGIDSVKTPIGTLMISPNPRYKGGDIKEPMKVLVCNTPNDWRVEQYCNALNAILANRKASVINLSIADESIERATDIINTVIEVYKKEWINDKNHMNEATAEFIDQRLDIIRNELFEVDREISAYKSKNALPDLAAIVSVDLAKQSEAERKIIELQSQYTMAKGLQEFINNPENSDKVLPSLSITGLVNGGNANAEITEYNTTLMERNRLVSANSVSNPLVKDFDRRLEGMRKAIAQTVSTQVDQLKTALNDMIAERNRASGRIANSPNQANDLLGVERQQEVKEALYLYLLEKKEENDLSQTFTAYNTRIITPPMGTGNPVSPQNKKVLILAFVFAMVVPTGLIFVKFNMDTLVRSRADIDARVKAPFLGSVPFYGKKPSKIRQLLKKKNQEDQPSEIIVKRGNGSAVNEAFRMIRSNLELMNSRLLAEREEKSIVTMITSAIPGSGKTFVSLNLAAAYALKNVKVAVVDVDLRKATLSKTFGAPHRGVTSYLSGTSTLDEITIKNASGMDNLDVIPAGAIPPDPAELIDSPQFKKMIEELRAKYDVVLLDCPPTEPVTDSLVITRLADRTVYVVRVGNLHRDFLETLQEYYDTKRYANLTTVLNAVEGGSSKASYGYGYGYGYGNNKED